MRLSDFFDFERGPESIVRLAACALLVLVIGGLAMEALSHLRAVDLLLIMLFFAIASPIAYSLREHRLRRDRRLRQRRGAERTPLVPMAEEDDE